MGPSPLIDNPKDILMTHDQSPIKERQPIDDGVVVYLEGDIEFSRSPILRTELIALLNQEQPKRLVIDMSAVPYMDSSGVATFVEALQAQRQTGSKLVLCCLQQKVYSMFQIASLDSLFTIVDDLESAKQV